MNKKFSFGKSVAFLALAVLFAACASFSSFADTLLSEYWGIDDAGRWHVYDSAGNMQKDCWVCDDITGPDNSCFRYLIDRNGDVVTAPLVCDAAGYYYSMVPDGSGLAALRCTDGEYDGIRMEFNTVENGHYGSLKNQDAVELLINRYAGSIAYVGSPSSIRTSRLDVAAAAGQAAVPRSGELYHNPRYLSSSANFTINNARGSNTYVKLYSVDGELVSTVFIRKDEKVKVYIPGGTYRMKQAFGDTWYGEEVMFGSEGKYWMCSVNGNYDIPLKRAGVYVISTSGNGQAISKEAVDLGTF